MQDCFPEHQCMRIIDFPVQPRFPEGPYPHSNSAGHQLDTHALASVLVANHQQAAQAEQHDFHLFIPRFS
jgi:hypothetical protein